MNYWVNSNSGDYIVEDGGQYRLYLLARYVDNKYVPSEIIELSSLQFKVIKGFIPIKEKKLFSRLSEFNRRKKYAPTLSDGTKGESERVKVPTVAEAREKILKDLGL